MYGRSQKLFAVEAIPHTFTLTPMARSRMSTSATRLSKGKLKKLVAQSRKLQIAAKLGR